MNQVSKLVRWDKVLKVYTVDFIGDGEDETAVFRDNNQACKFVKELQAKGYGDLPIY